MEVVKLPNLAHTHTYTHTVTHHIFVEDVTWGGSGREGRWVVRGTPNRVLWGRGLPDCRPA